MEPKKRGRKPQAITPQQPPVVDDGIYKRPDVDWELNQTLEAIAQQNRDLFHGEILSNLVYSRAHPAGS